MVIALEPGLTSHNMLPQTEIVALEYAVQKAAG
jgi:hypothetical protein